MSDSSGMRDLTDEEKAARKAESDGDGRSPADVEALAKILHEAGREAVEKGLVVNKVPDQPFFSWEELTDVAREGRRVMARYLLDRCWITQRRCK